MGAGCIISAYLDQARASALTPKFSSGPACVREKFPFLLMLHYCFAVHAFARHRCPLTYVARWSTPKRSRQRSCGRESWEPPVESCYLLFVFPTSTKHLTRALTRSLSVRRLRLVGDLGQRTGERRHPVAPHRLLHKTNFYCFAMIHKLFDPGMIYERLRGHVGFLEAPFEPPGP